MEYLLLVLFHSELLVFAQLQAGLPATLLKRVYVRNESCFLIWFDLLMKFGCAGL